MIRKIHFDSELNMKLPVPRTLNGLIGITYKGNDKYEIKAMDIKSKEIVFDKILEFPQIKGNSRRNFSRLRDMALNAVESRPLTYART